MNVNDLIFNAETVRWLVMLALGIYSWVIGRQAASAKELLELRTRIITLEAQVQSLPSQEQFNVMMNEVSRMGAHLEGVMTNVDALTRSINRTNDYLLHHK